MDIQTTEDMTADQLLEFTADIIAAYVSNNSVPATELPNLIADVHAALDQVVKGSSVEVAAELKPAVPIKKSVTPDWIICLEDGKKFKSLRRHLGVLGMTAEEYRVKWGLPSDYPMVAPHYAAKRSELAKQSGLGRKAEESVRRGRKKAV